MRVPKHPITHFEDILSVPLAFTMSSTVTVAVFLINHFQCQLVLLYCHCQHQSLSPSTASSLPLSLSLHCRCHGLGLCFHLCFIPCHFHRHCYCYCICHCCYHCHGHFDEISIGCIKLGTRFHLALWRHVGKSFAFLLRGLESRICEFKGHFLSFLA